MDKRELEEKINQQYSRILDLKNFLASKDYMPIREMQGGEPMPDEVKKQCADARSEINQLQAQIADEEAAMAEMEEEVGPEETIEA